MFHPRSLSPNNSRVLRLSLRTVGAAALAVAIVTVRHISAPRDDDSVERTSHGAVRVHGTLRLGNKPLANTIVEFSHGPKRGITVNTDAEGRFETGLWSDGEYKVTVKTVPHLGSTHRFVTLNTGDNNVDLRLPATRIHVTVADVTDGQSPSPVQVLARGPASPTNDSVAGFVSSAESTGFDLIGIGEGVYTLTAYTPDGKTARHKAVVHVSDRDPSASVSLHLTRRSLKLEVRTTAGELLDYARLWSEGRSLEPTARGMFDATAVPPGQDVTVQAAGYMPTCVSVDDAMTGVVQVSLAPAGTATLLISLKNGPDHPIGTLEPFPGGNCSVGVESFRVESVTPLHPGDTTFRVRGLLPGQYSYRASRSAPPATADVPGTPIRYVVPAFCRVCG